MGAPGVRVYNCPGPGGFRSLYPDLRDCPSYSEQLKLGANPAKATRYLGARGTIVSEAEYAGIVATGAKPAALDTRKLIGYALGAFALLILLLLLAKRRRK
jgi:hypothetical protein